LAAALAANGQKTSCGRSVVTKWISAQISGTKVGVVAADTLAG
jgi:hypothetical protein